MSGEPELRASVRVEGYGYDVYFDPRRNRFCTQRIVPGGVTSGIHSHTDALYLTARLSHLARPHDEDLDPQAMGQLKKPDRE